MSKLSQLVLFLCWFTSCFYGQAESKPCELPLTLFGYDLFAKISGMDYKTDLNAMSFRKLSFSNKKLYNQSLISGEMFSAFYTYHRFYNNIAMIKVYQDPRLTRLLYFDLLFCETDLVGKLIFTPSSIIPFDNFGDKQLTAKYVLRSDG
ncbi:hypothetical protein [uncultured Shewanella sp.]|uniref:hypothetical protein n=1 Tax=uncultured Shewanella sp. TaxID=173975 RepID=UPI0026064ECB|nr:hypothetical protein [uncultured Shewanella sp.]